MKILSKLHISSPVTTAWQVAYESANASNFTHEIYIFFNWLLIN